MTHTTLTGHLKNRLCACMVALAAVTLVAASGPAASAPRDVAQEEANHQLVLTFYERFFNQHDPDATRVIAEDYRQHNPAVPDGKAAVVAFLTQYFKDYPQARFRVARSAAHGDLVWLHVHSTRTPNDPGRAVVEIFRVRDGRIVEHWDAIQPVSVPLANGNTMF